MEINKKKMINSYTGMFMGRFGGSFDRYARPAVKKSCEFALQIVEYLEREESEGGYEDKSDRMTEFEEKFKSIKQQLKQVIEEID
jgi:hypothetical protein